MSRCPVLFNRGKAGIVGVGRLAGVGRFAGVSGAEIRCIEEPGGWLLGSGEE